MKKQFLIISFGVLLSGVILSACKKDKIEENDEEIITTMRLTFIPTGGGSTLIFQYDDIDGPGGSVPIQDEIILAPSKTYTVTVQLLNKTTTPVADITTEVAAEADAHRFYYEPTAAGNITVFNLDNDLNGVPVGVTSTWTTGMASTGSIIITLRHYPAVPPNKAVTDAVNSDKSGTDAEIKFTTRIQ